MINLYKRKTVYTFSTIEEFDNNRDIIDSKSSIVLISVTEKELAKYYDYERLWRKINVRICKEY